MIPLNTHWIASDFSHTMAAMFGVDMCAASQAKRGVTPAVGESLLSSIAEMGFPIQVGLDRAAFCSVSFILVHTRAMPHNPMLMLVLLFWQHGLCPSASKVHDDFAFTKTNEYSSELGGLHMAVTCLRCYDASCNDKDKGPYVNLLEGVVKKPVKFKTQFNQLFWDVWPKISACLGDFSQYLNDYVDDEDSREKAIDKLMADKIDLTTNVDVPEWELEQGIVVNDNIISLFDQLCYLVVFGNRFDMEARVVNSEERNLFFDGIRNNAAKARDAFVTSWKMQLGKEMVKYRNTKSKSVVRCSGIFDSSEESSTEQGEEVVEGEKVVDENVEEENVVGENVQGEGGSVEGGSVEKTTRARNE